MITKTYICDSCKKSVGETELTTLSISLKVLTSPNGYTKTLTASKDVCRECLEKKGVLVTLPEGQKEEEVYAKSKKCLEDKIADFLADLGVVFEQ
jgi:hypothetical protein